MDAIDFDKRFSHIILAETVDGQWSVKGLGQRIEVAARDDHPSGRMRSQFAGNREVIGQDNQVLLALQAAGNGQIGLAWGKEQGIPVVDQVDGDLADFTALLALGIGFASGRQSVEIVFATEDGAAVRADQKTFFVEGFQITPDRDLRNTEHPADFRHAGLFLFQDITADDSQTFSSKHELSSLQWFG